MTIRRLIASQVTPLRENNGEVEPPSLANSWNNWKLLFIALNTPMFIPEKNLPKSMCSNQRCKPPLFFKINTVFNITINW